MGKPLLDMSFELDREALQELGPTVPDHDLRALEARVRENRFVLEGRRGELLRGGDGRVFFSMWVNAIFHSTEGRFSSAHLKIKLSSGRIRDLYPEEVTAPTYLSAQRTDTGFEFHSRRREHIVPFALDYQPILQGSGIGLSEAWWSFEETDGRNGVPARSPLYLLIGGIDSPTIDADVVVSAQLQLSGESKPLPLHLKGSLRDLMGELDLEDVEAYETREEEPSTHEETSAIAAPHPLSPGLTKDYELTIHRSKSEGDWQLTYKLSAMDPDRGLNDMPYGTIALEVEPQVYFRDLLKDIEGLGGDSEEERKKTLHRLENIGAKLRKLLPPTLQDELSELSSENGRLLIQSEDPWIPWELLSLPRDPKKPARFLCEAFAVTRWRPGIGRISTLPLSRMAVIVPTDSDLSLPLAPWEKSDVLSLGQPSVRQVVEIEASFTSLVDALASGDYDGYHFVGHGNAVDKDPDRAVFWLGESGELFPNDLLTMRLGRQKPLVFLNVCRSGRSGLALTGLGGWAERFLEAGAGAFIGTLWSVPDSKARAFAKAFYGHFLSGQTISEAVRATRLELRAQNPGDPTWLAYTVFAHPKAICPTAPPPDE